MIIWWCWTCRYSWVQFRNGTWWPDKRTLCTHYKHRMGG